MCPGFSWDMSGTNPQLSAPSQPCHRGLPCPATTATTTTASLLSLPPTHIQGSHTHTGARNIIKVLIHRNYGWIFFSPTINSPSRPHFFFLGNLKNLLVLYRWQSREQERFLKRQGEKNQRRGRMNRKGEVRWRYVGDRKTERKREFQVEASGRLWECADVFPNAHYNTCYPDNTHYLLRYGPGTRPYFMTTIFAWSSNRLQTKHTQIYKPFLILLYFSFTLTFQIHSDV